MKYSICDFSQAEITKFNDINPDNMLDPIDLLIFQWFIDFVAASNIPRKNGKKTKGMWKKIYDECEYFYIKYDALIDEFPILGYQSVKSIQRRFDKYVKTGLLCKKVFHEGRKGSFSYFAFTEKLFSLKYDDSKQEQKINPHKTEATNITNNGNDTEDKTVQCNTEHTEDNIVHCKDNETGTEDKTVQCNNLTEDKTVQYYYINNPTTNLNNSTTTSGLVEAELLKKTNQIFGFDVDFQPNPFPELVCRLKKSEVPTENWNNYLEWVYKYLKERVKNKNSFDGYFFKSFTQVALIQKYKRTMNEKTAVEKQCEITCPVCGFQHNKYEDCKCCGLELMEIKDKESVRIKKQIWNLPETQRSSYNEKMRTISEKYLNMGLQAVISPQIINQKNSEIKKINAEYNIG